MEALADRFELVQGDFALQIQQLRATPHPLALDAFAFSVIVVGREMPRGIGFPAR